MAMYVNLCLSTSQLKVATVLGICSSSYLKSCTSCFTSDHFVRSQNRYFICLFVCLSLFVLASLLVGFLWDLGHMKKTKETIFIFNMTKRNDWMCSGKCLWCWAFLSTVTTRREEEIESGKNKRRSTIWWLRPKSHTWGGRYGMLPLAAILLFGKTAFFFFF